MVKLAPGGARVGNTGIKVRGEVGVGDKGRRDVSRVFDFRVRDCFAVQVFRDLVRNSFSFLLVMVGVGAVRQVKHILRSICTAQWLNLPGVFCFAPVSNWQQ